MVPPAIRLVRSCGILGVFGSLAVWLGNLILLLGGAVLKGVMSTGFMVGGPATVAMMPWASIVVPCGIEARRATVSCHQ
jgi:hypothetical protein